MGTEGINEEQENLDNKVGSSTSIRLIARSSLALILIVSGLLWIGMQSRLPIFHIFSSVPSIVFLSTLIALIAILSFFRGRTGLREGLSVLPIPLATSTAIVHLIFFLLDPEPGKELEAFAISLTPLIWAAVSMVIGLSLPIVDDTERSPGNRPSGVSIARDFLVITVVTLFWSFCAALLYDEVSFLDLWVPGYLVPCFVVFGGLALMSKGQQPVWSFLGTCALKAGFAVSAVTMTTYLLFLANQPTMNETGYMLALGWITLLCASASITAMQFMSVLNYEDEMAESIKRNWHFLELFGFYIFLSMAPPTFFDIFGF